MWVERFTYHKLFHSFVCKSSALEADGAHANGLIFKKRVLHIEQCSNKMV